jgi:hypothetical protein
MSSKKILVVTTSRYLDLASRLTGHISKMDFFESSCMTVTSFEEDKSIMDKVDYLIILGHPEDNSLSKQYLPEINNLENNSGAIYGFRGKIAVICGDGDLSKLHLFMKLFKEGYAPVAHPPYNIFSLIVTAQFFASLNEDLTDRKKKAKLRKSQTEMGIKIFLYEKFSLWTSSS